MNKEEHTKLLKITYDTLRPIFNVIDKVNIVSIILYAYDDSLKFSKLLYKKDYLSIYEELEALEIKLEIDLNNKNVKECFNDTIDKLIIEFDKDGFYKALYEKDPFAIACHEVSEQFENKKSKFKRKEKIKKQLIEIPEYLGQIEML